MIKKNYWVKKKSPLCDCTITNIPKSQIGFIKFIIRPTFVTLSQYIPSLKTNVLPLNTANLNNMQQKLEQQSLSNDNFVLKKIQEEGESLSSSSLEKEDEAEGPATKEEEKEERDNEKESSVSSSLPLSSQQQQPQPQPNSSSSSFKKLLVNRKQK